MARPFLSSNFRKVSIYGNPNPQSTLYGNRYLGKNFSMTPSDSFLQVSDASITRVTAGQHQC